MFQPIRLQQCGECAHDRFRVKPLQEFIVTIGPGTAALET